jgi:hypothetical protein
MFKKIAIGASTAAAALVLAVPAFAHMSMPHMSSLSLSNSAYVHNDVTTKANSGDNSIGGLKVKGGSITTDLAGAGSEVDNTLNSNNSSCGCGSTHGVTTLKNMATVHNDVNTSANTGYNTIGGLKVSGGHITTGEADATSLVTNVVNSNVVE